jgi:hypothetical protein
MNLGPGMDLDGAGPSAAKAASDFAHNGTTEVVPFPVLLVVSFSVAALRSG